MINVTLIKMGVNDKITTKKACIIAKMSNISS
jgi:hypothetical protein